jgi:hypothetical protein
VFLAILGVSLRIEPRRLIRIELAGKACQRASEGHPFVRFARLRAVLVNTPTQPRTQLLRSYPDVTVLPVRRLAAAAAASKAEHVRRPDRHCVASRGPS